MEDWECEEQEYEAELQRLYAIQEEVSARGPWKIQRHDSVDKSFRINNIDTGLTLYADYDDVDHRDVDHQVAELVRMLNTEAYLGTYSA